MVSVWSIPDTVYVSVEDTDKMHKWMLMSMDIDAKERWWCESVWKIILDWIGLKIIDTYEWIWEICGISCIDMKEQCAYEIIVIS